MKGVLVLRVLLGLSVVSLSGVVQSEKYDPEYEHYIAPIYPSDLHRKEVSGCVKLSYIVRRDGSVSDISIVETTHPQFANAAMYAAARWRFRPWDVVQDKPASVQWIVNIDFGADLDRGCTGRPV